MCVCLALISMHLRVWFWFVYHVGKTDWKVIVIDVNDPLANEMNGKSIYVFIKFIVWDVNHFNSGVIFQFVFASEFACINWGDLKYSCF